MGYAMAFGECFCCRVPFYFNPLRVPSTPPAVHPTREPICKPCMTEINTKRQQIGLAPFPVFPDAYQAVEESELP